MDCWCWGNGANKGGRGSVWHNLMLGIGSIFFLGGSHENCRGILSFIYKPDILSREDFSKGEQLCSRVFSHYCVNKAIMCIFAHGISGCPRIEDCRWSFPPPSTARNTCTLDISLSGLFYSVTDYNWWDKLGLSCAKLKFS